MLKERISNDCHKGESSTAIDEDNSLELSCTDSVCLERFSSDGNPSAHNSQRYIGIGTGVLDSREDFVPPGWSVLEMPSDVQEVSPVVPEGWIVSVDLLICCYLP